MYLLTETPANPTINYIIAASIGTILTLLGNFLIKRLDTSTTVKVAEINSNKESHEEIKKQLTDALNSIDEINKKLAESRIKNQAQSKIITEYKNLLKHFKVLVNILYKQLPEDVKNNPDNMVVIEHIQKSMEDLIL